MTIILDCKKTLQFPVGTLNMHGSVVQLAGLPVQQSSLQNPDSPPSQTPLPQNVRPFTSVAVVVPTFRAAIQHLAKHLVHREQPCGYPRRSHLEAHVACTSQLPQGITNGRTPPPVSTPSDPQRSSGVAGLPGSETWVTLSQLVST